MSGRISGKLSLRIQLSDDDKRQIASEAEYRRAQQPSMARRMLQAEASERAERGEPYNERRGG